VRKPNIHCISTLQSEENKKELAQTNGFDPRKRYSIAKAERGKAATKSEKRKNFTAENANDAEKRDFLGFAPRA